MAAPGDRGAFTCVPRLDHDLVGRLQHEALAGFDDIVVQIALAGEPHAAAQDRKLASQALDLHRGIELQSGGACLGEKLRSHHESPGWLQTMFRCIAPV